MRKLAWLFVILTLLVWLAIARYWTGTGLSSAIPLEVPTRPIPISTENTVITPTITPVLTATRSAESATKSGTPTPGLVY